MILDSFKLTTDSNSLILFVWHKEPRVTSHHKQRKKEEVRELLLALVSDCQCTSHASLTWQQRKLGGGGGAYELCGACRHLPHSLISPRRSQDKSRRPRVTFAKDKEASKIMGTLWRKRSSACSQELQVLSMVARVVPCHSSGRFFHTNSLDLT